MLHALFLEHRSWQDVLMLLRGVVAFLSDQGSESRFHRFDKFPLTDLFSWAPISDASDQQFEFHEVDYPQPEDFEFTSELG
eukprot:12632662-Alexandrium_andersonii.AAC.1